jgi:magnesium chelatase subunit H
MARKLRQNNPEAFRNIIKRMLEAKGRGFWDPSDDVVEKLQEAFEDVEDMIEGV